MNSSRRQQQQHDADDNRGNRSSSSRQSDRSQKEHLRTLYAHVCAYEQQQQQQQATVACLNESASVAAKYRDLICFDAALSRKYDLPSRLWKRAVYPFVELLRGSVRSSSSSSSSSRPSTSTSTPPLPAWSSWMSSIDSVLLDVHAAAAASASASAVAAALNWLGDLKRYRAQLLLPSGPERRAALLQASSFYSRASLASPTNGEHVCLPAPLDRTDWTGLERVDLTACTGFTGFFTSQLAGVEALLGHPLEAAAHYMRSLCVKVPFMSARDALKSLLGRARSEHATQSASASAVAFDASRTELVQSKGSKGSLRSKGSKPRSSQTDDNAIDRQFMGLIEILVTRISPLAVPVSVERFPEDLAQLKRACRDKRHNRSQPATVTPQPQQRSTAVAAAPLIVQQQRTQMHTPHQAACQTPTCALSAFWHNGNSSNSNNNNGSRQLYGECWQSEQPAWTTGDGRDDNGMDGVRCRQHTDRASGLAGFIPLGDVYSKPATATQSTASEIPAIETSAVSEDAMLCCHRQRLWVLQDALASTRPATAAAARDNAASLDGSVGMVVNSDEIRIVSFEELDGSSDGLDGQDMQPLDAPYTDTAYAAGVAKPAVAVGGLDTLAMLANDLDDPDANGHDSELQALKTMRDGLAGQIGSRKSGSARGRDTSRKSQSQSQPSAMQPSALPRLDPETTWLVLDTNCFCHTLPSVRQLLEMRQWKVVIPLAVLSELDGLQHGGGRASEQAALALEYVTSIFDTPDSPLADLKGRFVTIETRRGTLLATARFRNEDWLPDSLGSLGSLGSRGDTAGCDGQDDDSGQDGEADVAEYAIRGVDDVVMQCCLRRMPPTAAPSAMAGRGPQQQGGHTAAAAAAPVVLVTRDVNMRLKARAVGVPVVHSVSAVIAQHA
ncbi:hypothetical protein BC831DRAFT_506839 [Entophlyctis helioformis]|nr:hypothetical protein BC831DRAFT_506839 [Entophlyctis helioformis]